jgi:23S rRNA pseudouridine2605 synthase
LEERRNRPVSSGQGKTQARPKQAATTKPSGELVRLNKYISAAGICSRREADDLISAGLIMVNGKTVTQLGSKVNPGDEVRYNGERIRTERKVYLLLNKPKDYVTTTDDPKERKTVMLLIRDACSERIYPVGRLDRNTTGVLLFTNDGELAKKMTHPSSNKKKIYHVFLDKNFSAGDMKKLAEGITLEDGFIQPDAIGYASTENKREIGLEIHSGKNRIVRRIFESLGYRVDKLDRVYFGGLTKKNLPRGKWRFLTEKEVTMLKMNAYE